MPQERKLRSTAHAVHAAHTTPDTLPRWLMHNAQRYSALPAMRKKEFGIWHAWNWREMTDEVRGLACGLAKLGFKRGHTLAVIGDNRPRLYWAMAAAQMLGGVAVPLYQDAVADEMRYVLQDAEIHFAAVEDQEQVDKLLEIKPHCRGLRHILYDKARGMRHYSQTYLLGLDEVIAMGRIVDAHRPDFILGEIDQGLSSDIAAMLYTSGATGTPKGVRHTHAALIAAAQGGIEFDRLTQREEILSYLPMAWVGDHLFSYAQALVAGFTVNCPESSDTVLHDLCEIGPTYYFAPPRVFENLLTQLQIRMADGSAARLAIYNFFMNVAKRCGTAILDRKPATLADRLLYAIGEAAIYAPLRNALGLSRIRVAYTAGGAIGHDLFRFYRSIGINLKQLYGATETCAAVCMQPDREVKFDSVGKPLAGVSIKIANSGEIGEILVRGKTLFTAYHKRPDDTAAAIDADGWFHTGDAGFFDRDGHLKLIDRIRDIGQLRHGAPFAPNYIESKLRFFPYIEDAVCFGHGRDTVCALLTIDRDAVAQWAERRGIAFVGYCDLAVHTEVLALIRSCVESANAELAHDEAIAATQVHRFAVLPKELSPDDGEMTRTRKLRRAFIEEKYAVLIDALYAGKDSQFIALQVEFADGRSGELAAELSICAAKVTPWHKKAHP